MYCQYGSLKGIEYFTSLNIILFLEFWVKSLDLSKNTKLKKLNVHIVA